MRNDQKSEKHHYVPQFLLREFCIPYQKQIYVYDKLEKKVFKSNIKNIASETNFYAAKTPSYEINLESFMTSIEADTSKAIQKLLKEKALQTLTKQDVCNIGFFATIQLLRTNHAKEMNKIIMESMRKKAREITGTDDPGKLNENTLKYNFLKNLGVAPDLARHIYQKEWILLDNPFPDLFYISDNPLVLHNEREFGPWGNLGLALPGIQIYLPISPKLILGFLCPSAHMSEHENYREITNKRAFSVLGATEKMRNEAKELLDKCYVQFPNMDRDLEYISKIKRGDAAKIKFADNVTWLNSLQVQFSHRFLYSSDGNFELVERMLKEDPSLKNGILPIVD